MFRSFDATFTHTKSYICTSIISYFIVFTLLWVVWEVGVFVNCFKKIIICPKIWVHMNMCTKFHVIISTPSDNSTLTDHIFSGDMFGRGSTNFFSCVNTQAIKNFKKCLFLYKHYSLKLKKFFPKMK